MAQYSLLGSLLLAIVVALFSGNSVTSQGTSGFGYVAPVSNAGAANGSSYGVFPASNFGSPSTYGSTAPYGRPPTGQSGPSTTDRYYVPPVQQGSTVNQNTTYDPLSSTLKIRLSVEYGGTPWDSGSRVFPVADGRVLAVSWAGSKKGLKIQVEQRFVNTTTTTSTTSTTTTTSTTPAPSPTSQSAQFPFSK